MFEELHIQVTAGVSRNRKVMLMQKILTIFQINKNRKYFPALSTLIENFMQGNQKLTTALLL